MPSGASVHIQGGGQTPGENLIIPVCACVSVFILTLTYISGGVQSFFFAQNRSSKDGVFFLTSKSFRSLLLTGHTHIKVQNS